MIEKMIAHIFLIQVCIVVFTSVSYSQVNQNGPISGTQKKPVITKGYYSIYGNGEKLKTRTENVTNIQSSTPSLITKGYYSIRGNINKVTGNRTDLGETGFAGTLFRSPLKDVKKGYYSIGTNVEKLKKASYPVNPSFKGIESSKQSAFENIE